MDRRDWQRTPYAMTNAQDPDAAVVKLLGKYAITKFSTIHDTIAGRPGYGVRFQLNGLWYVVAFPTLDVDRVEPAHLLRQIKRLVFYTLKSLLETSSAFIAPEQLLLPFLEIHGKTLYQQLEPKLELLKHGKDTNLIGMDA